MKLGFIFFIVFFSFFQLNSQDSLNMTKLANLSGMAGNAYNDIWGYTDGSGVEYAIIGSAGAINIVDVSDCQNPIIDTSYMDGSNVTWRDFKTYQNYVYAICDGGACDNEGLEIINMTTGAFSQSNAHFNKAHNIYIEENTGRLYVVGSNGPADLIIYDLTADPSNPTHLVSKDFGSGVPNYIHDIYVKDYIAYASHGYSGYAIYDVSDPLDIINLSTYTNSTSYNHSSWKDPYSEYSYTAYEVPTGIPIDIFKIDNDYNIQKKGDFSMPNIPSAPTLNRPHNPFIKGDSLYISYYHDGVQVWDISKKEDPQLVSKYDTYPSNVNYENYYGCWGIYPFFESGCLVASDLSTGLYTFKLLPPKVGLSGASLVIDNAQAGLVLMDTLGNYHRIQVNKLGNLVVSPYIDLGNKTTNFMDSDLNTSSTSNGIILKNHLDKYYKVLINSSNVFYTQEVLLPTSKVSDSSDIMFNKSTNGLYMTTDANVIVRVGVSTSGQITAIPWPF